MGTDIEHLKDLRNRYDMKDPAFNIITPTGEVFARIRLSMMRRCQIGVGMNGGHNIEHLSIERQCEKSTHF